MKFDFHCHSDFSDGTLSPRHLWERAHANQLTGWALTDHDTVDGVTALYESGVVEGRHPIFVPGVEISATCHDTTIHVLGLNIDVFHPQLQKLLAKHQAIRQTRHQWFCSQMRHFWPEIDWAQLFKKIVGQGVPCRSHIARALTEAKLAQNVGQAFEKWLRRGKRLAYRTNWSTATEVIRVIHEAGGDAGLAHPARYRLSKSRLTQLMEILTQDGLDFIEVSYPGVQPSQQNWLSRLCQRLRLRASIGSDYHGPEQGWNDLGRCHLPENNVPIWTTWPDFQNG
ncbi:MAG: PHP domain-containing protein [Gammaproteobacteria bacterium]|nr:MAG: PHP domain-containing protein [Gammaproteobacteria bacterium]